MSIKLDLFPTLLFKGQGLHFYLENPTNSDQDITIHFLADNTEIVSVTATVKAFEAFDFILSDEALGLSAYEGKVISAYPEIPSPATGVYLAGTTQAPETKGNAKYLYVSASKKITIVDEKGNPVPYAHVSLLDYISGSFVHVTADKDGVAVIPDRPYEAGKWLLEVFKPDYARGVVYYNLIKDYDFSDKTVTVYLTRYPIVTLGFNAPKDDVLQDTLKAVVEWIPEPLRTGIKAIASSLGWLHDTVINAVWNAVVYLFGTKTGVRVIRASYNASENRLEVTVIPSSVSSPLAGAVIEFIMMIVRWGLGLALAYIIWQIVEAFTGTKIKEEETKRMQVINDILNKLKDEHDKGAISDETYNECVKQITDVKDWQEHNTPSVPVGLEWILPMVGVVLAIVVILELVRAFKR